MSSEMIRNQNRLGFACRAYHAPQNATRASPSYFVVVWFTHKQIVSYPLQTRRPINTVWHELLVDQFFVYPQFYGIVYFFQPAQWQLSSDGRKFIGHMTLRKPITDADPVPGAPPGIIGRGALGKLHFFQIIKGRLTQTLT